MNKVVPGVSEIGVRDALGLTTAGYVYITDKIVFFHKIPYSQCINSYTRIDSQTSG